MFSENLSRDSNTSNFTIVKKQCFHYKRISTTSRREKANTIFLIMLSLLFQTDNPKEMELKHSSWRARERGSEGKQLVQWGLMNDVCFP